MHSFAILRHITILTLCAACAACSTGTAIPNDAPQIPAPGTALTDGGAASPVYASAARYSDDCRDIAATSAGRRCDMRPLTTPPRGVDASEFFAVGTQSNAESDAMVRNRNQADFLRNSPQLGGAGAAAALDRQRIQLEQNSSRLARDRLRTAPYSRTVGSINQ